MPDAVDHPADSLMRAIDRVRAPVCVGIDPVVERLPHSLRAEPPSSGGRAEAIARFSRGILAAVRGIVPCVKFQSACFERHGSEGVRALERLIQEARDLDLVVILDAKRGDIGVTAEHYAHATLGSRTESSSQANWVTVNSYLGADGIAPFLEHGGVFALVRTSNPGGDALQKLSLKDGRSVAEAVADMVADVGRTSVGESGYSRLGAVVGATKREEAARLRDRMPQQLFLVPGYGAQGGGVEDVLPCFHERGRGAIVTASRSVIYAFHQDDANWMLAVRSAAEALAHEIGSAVGLR